MGSYDKNPTELDLLKYGANGIYKIAKDGFNTVKNGVKEVVKYVQKPTVPVGKPKVQNLETQPKTLKQQNEEYKAKMDRQYGSGFNNFINGIFGGKI